MIRIHDPNPWYEPMIRIHDTNPWYEPWIRPQNAITVSNSRYFLKRVWKVRARSPILGTNLVWLSRTRLESPIVYASIGNLSKVYRNLSKLYRTPFENQAQFGPCDFLSAWCQQQQANYLARFFKSVVLRFMRTTITAYLCPLNTLQTTEPFTNVHTCSVPSCILHGGICGNTF